MITRRNLFDILAAPAIIRTPGLLMAIKPHESYLRRMQRLYGGANPLLFHSWASDPVEIGKYINLAYGDGNTIIYNPEGLARIKRVMEDHLS